MDNKNVFIAIALSMSVLLFWAAFFESPKPINNNTVQEQKKSNENIMVKMGISTVSSKNALENMMIELPHWEH